MRVSILALLSILLVSIACDGDQQGLSTGSESIFRGERAESQMGASVALLGDINGDGLDDFALGLPGDRLNGEASGSVYVYYGNAMGFAVAPDAILVGESGDRFGESIASLGDLNLDGLEEFAVSSEGALGEGLVESAAVYIFQGRTNGLLRTAEEQTNGVRASVTAENRILDVQGGASALVVSSGGDLNHDGGLDLAIGSPAENRVYVFFSSENFIEVERLLLSQASLVLMGEADSDFGSSLAAAADVNRFNEGLNSRFGDDLLIGAPGEQGKGAAYLVLGSAGLTRSTTSVGSLATKFEGKEEGSEFGFDVTGLGDFDADGVLDIAIGAPGDSAGGSVWIFFGESIAGPRDIGPARFTGEFREDRFGASLTSMYPNGWGGLFPVVAGAPSNPIGGGASGSVFLLSNAIFTGDATPRGASASAAVADRRFLNPLAGSGLDDRFGESLSGGLDINGDAQADLLIGAPGNDRGGENAGFTALEY